MLVEDSTPSHGVETRNEIPAVRLCLRCGLIVFIIHVLFLPFIHGSNIRISDCSDIRNSLVLLSIAGFLMAKFLFFKQDADKNIIRTLKEQGRLLVSSTFTHSYPFCWR